jgi:hypothetical protein
MFRMKITKANMAIVLGLSVFSTAQAADTIERQRALQLFRAITGVSISIDDARIIKMENEIASGNERAAAAIATGDPLFYDVRLRDMAKVMSNREETVNVPVNDFVATFVGAVRDDVDARQLLTGDFFYRANTALATIADASRQVRSNLIPDLLSSNNHYADIENKNHSLFASLVRVDGQLKTDGTVTQPMPDPAGLITTRSFIEAHAEAGTNRRLVEYSFREFMCAPITTWMDASRPDTFVGRDVDRFPGGSNERFQMTCKACHSQMDAFRPAFALIDFGNNRIQTSTTPVGKFARNSNVFPAGYAVNDNNWTNLATAPKNEAKFGWRDEGTGSGINSFGKLLANSKGYSRCMVKRIFSTLCNRDPLAAELSVLDNVAKDFESDYKIKRLAETVAVHPLCLPKTGGI